MKDVIIKLNSLVCAYCRTADKFEAKRTFRAKATFGIGALLTHKKLKCIACGHYNQVGNAQTDAPTHNVTRQAGNMAGPPPAEGPKQFSTLTPEQNAAQLARLRASLKADKNK